MEVLFDSTNALRLLQGMCLSLKIALIAMCFSIIFGFVLGFIMSVKSLLVRGICRFYLESIRIIPLLAWLFIVFFGISQFFDISLSAVSSAIIVFSLWGIAELGDLVRGALSALPKHQRQSAKALGLKEWQILCFILLPQAIKRLLPSIVSLFTRMIKSTSLVALIGAVDLLKVGEQIIELHRANPQASFFIYGGIFVVYFMLCYPLSVFSKYLERKCQ